MAIVCYMVTVEIDSGEKLNPLRLRGVIDDAVDMLRGAGRLTADNDEDTIVKDTNVEYLGMEPDNIESDSS